MIKNFFLNPLSLWFVRWVQAATLELNNRGKHLKIGYLSFAHGCTFGLYNTIYNNVHLTDVQLGDASYVANDTIIAHTSIGKFCSIGPGVRCGLGVHPTDFVSTHPMFFSPKQQAGRTFADREYFQENRPVRLGHDVWIGANSIIVDGVSIGHGAIVAAGAVVTKDVEPYAIVGGVPAKLIRFRFSPDKIERLLASGWWDKDWDWLQQNWQTFHRVDEFIETQT